MTWPGDADHHRVGGHRSDHDGVRPDPAVVADGDGAEDLRAGADSHPVANGRVTLRLAQARAAQSHPLVQGDLCTDFSRLTDDHAGCVVDEQALAQNGAGMDVHPGERSGHRGQHPGHQLGVVLPQPVADPVAPDGMQPRVAEDDLGCGAGCRVAVACGLQVVAQGRQHGQSVRPSNRAVDR